MPVAPAMGPPDFFHWKVGAGAPLAATVRMTEPPALIVTLATGWVVITGNV